ncbi:MAG: biopolymer transporter ExbD [Pontiella sp.]
MRRKNRRPLTPPAGDIDVSMTPMIDVVFQLLIYFLVTFSAADVLAFLDISRPAPDIEQSMPPADMIRIAVLKQGFAMNGRPVSDEELEGLIRQLALVSTKQTVLVNCEEQSLHGRLIQVLDLCASHKLTQISVMSSP